MLNTHVKDQGTVLFLKVEFHKEEVFHQAFYDTQAHYIGMNPVKARFVEKEEEDL